MRTVILCGGLGTRAYPYTKRIPKALMPVAGLPIVEQVMRIYAAQGFDDFVLAAGYLGEDLVRYFDGSSWKVEVVDTGTDADTGERVRCCLPRLGETFFATYCDGLGDVDLVALSQRHRQAGGSATLTATPLRSQYGVLEVDDADCVTGFREKPVLPAHLINSGFFCFERRAFEAVAGDNLERDILPAVAATRELHIHRHGGFWRSMDTFKDQQELDRMWEPFSVALDRQLGVGAAPAHIPSWLTERYQLVEEES